MYLTALPSGAALECIATHDDAATAASVAGQPEDRRRAREAGCDHHLVKPDAAAVDGLLGSFN
jgi:hypothetical protein